MQYDRFGKELQTLLAGVRNGSEFSPVADAKDGNVEYGGYSQDTPRELPAYMKNVVLPEKPKASDVVMMSNARARLVPGHLLLGVQKDNSVFTFDPETGRAEIVCRFYETPMLLWRAIPAPDGTFYCCFSGTRWPSYPTDVAFGQGGAVFKIDHRAETMTIVPGTDDLQDPADMLLLDNGDLIVTDFQGFGGTGAIYQLDARTGEKKPLVSGGLLREPVSTVRATNGTLFIANAQMSYSHPLGPSGQHIKELGAILKLDPKDGPHAAASQLQVLYDESKIPRGVIDSLCIDPKDLRFLVFTRNDWPTQETGGLFRLNLENGDVDPIVEATPGLTTFARIDPGMMANVVYSADSYNKQMLKVDVEKGEVIERKSLTDILGPTIGMINPLETVESINRIK